jgi:hypothetical protein
MNGRGCNHSFGPFFYDPVDQNFAKTVQPVFGLDASKR